MKTKKRIHFVRVENPFSLVNTLNGSELEQFYAESIPEAVGLFVQLLNNLSDYQNYKLINYDGQVVCQAQSQFKTVLSLS